MRIPVLDLDDIMHRIPRERARLPEIVISCNQMLSAWKRFKNTREVTDGFRLPSESEVSEYPQIVVVIHRFGHDSDDEFIHLICALEWSITVFYDVRMPEMGVCRIPIRHRRYPTP